MYGSPRAGRMKPSNKDWNDEQTSNRVGLASESGTKVVLNLTFDHKRVPKGRLFIINTFLSRPSLQDSSRSSKRKCQTQTHWPVRSRC